MSNSSSLEGEGRGEGARRPHHGGIERLKRMSLLELRGRLRRARAMDLARLSMEAVTERLRRLMDGYATKTTIVGTNGVFRARINADNKSRFNNASELWYPPQSVVKLAGRFNRPGQVKFYVCNHPHAALMEAQPNVGDRITLLVAASRPPTAIVTCTQIGLSAGKEALEVRGLPGGITLQEDPRFLAHLREMGTERHWRLLDEYFTELAIAVPPPGTAQDHYKATNAVAEVLGGIEGQRGLFYPSVGTNLHSYNLALSPEGADELFLPFEAWQFEVVSHQASLAGAPDVLSGYTRIEVSARSEAIDEDGSIHWRTAPPEELMELHGAIRRANEARETGSR